jgi:hypothetical protein
VAPVPTTKSSAVLAEAVVAEALRRCHVAWTCCVADDPLDLPQLEAPSVIARPSDKSEANNIAGCGSMNPYGPPLSSLV